MKKKDPLWHGLNRKIRWARPQIPAFGDDEAWRAMLEEIGNSRSLGDMPVKSMARVVDHLANTYGIEFSSAKGKGRSNKPYQAKAAGRRSDFYEIPDGPQASRKRALCILWQKLGYEMQKLDARVKKQWGVEAFRWLNDPAALDILARDLNKRLARKEKKEAEALEAVPA